MFNELHFGIPKKSGGHELIVSGSNFQKLGINLSYCESHSSPTYNSWNKVQSNLQVSRLQTHLKCSVPVYIQ